MADKQVGAKQNGCGSIADAENNNEVNSGTTTSKRRSSESPCTSPPRKSPRNGPSPPATQRPGSGGGHPEAGEPGAQAENTEEPSCPPVSSTAPRKSWRRATITRRSFPALPNPYQVLCRSISKSLSPQERLEKLMEGSMNLAIERTQNSLKSLPNTSLECFQKQVEHIQKEWTSLAKSIHNSQSNQLPTNTSRSCDPAVQKAMEKVQKAINRLQAESDSWEELLNKHKTKAEELKQKMERGLEKGVSLDAGCVAQSSQHLFIQNKPDYRSLLCRQQPILHTIAMIMDTQSKMVRELLSIKEQSHLLVKETSGRLAAEAGFQDLSPDPIRNLIAAPLSSASV